MIAFRRHTQLPPADCLYALQPTIPHLTRSSLHRCLQRNGVSRLPQVEGEITAKRTFKTYPIGYFHIDLAEVRIEQGKLDMLVAIDRTSKLAFVELHETAKRIAAADFVTAYNLARRLKTLKGLTPCECVRKIWTKNRIDSASIQPIKFRD